MVKDPRLSFSLEKISDVWEETIDLVLANHSETGYLPPKDLDPKLSTYESIEASGILKVFIARIDGKVVGYSTFLIWPHIHYPSKIFATQDVMFIDKDHRGPSAVKFMRWQEQQLEGMGVNVILRHVSAKNDYSRTLSRLGYEETEKIFSRRIRWE